MVMPSGPAGAGSQLARRASPGRAVRESGREPNCHVVTPSDFLGPRVGRRRSGVHREMERTIRIQPDA
ncbi:MAG: hypothetical protein WBL31_09430 [Ilumatobacteraceae bacterium]